MFRTLRTSVLAALFATVFVAAASAQTGMIKGKVVDAKGQPVVGAKIVIEFSGGVNRKMETKSDKRGEFIQIGLQSGAYKVTASDDKLGSQSFPVQVRVGQTQEVNFSLNPAAAAAAEGASKATELKKLFEDGVAASRANNYDVAIEKFNAAAAVVPNCHDCYYNIGYAHLQKKDDKQAEAAWLKAVEIKPDYAEALNGLATLYNNQKRFDEATAMSAKAASAGGAGGSADAVYNQGIILWNQGKIPEAKAKFEEAIKANPNHPESNFQFGMALLNEGNLAGAIASFEKYLSLSPDGQFAGQAKAMLAQLKK